MGSRKTRRLVAFMKIESKSSREERVEKVEGDGQRGNFVSLRSSSSETLRPFYRFPWDL